MIEQRRLIAYLDGLQVIATSHTGRPGFVLEIHGA